MVNRSEGLLYQTGLGASALDAQAHRDRLDGYAVADGLGVTHSSGLTLSIASGTATVGETSGSVDTVSLGSSTTVTLDAADSTYPRKDTIYIDSSGTMQAETGTAEEALPSGNTRFNTYQPEPPFPSTEGTILAEVWVPAGATTLQSADIRDRRSPADVVGDRAVVQTLESGSVSTGRTNSRTYHVAPSLSAGYDTVQAAIDDGEADHGDDRFRVLVHDVVSESGIEVSTRGVTIEGAGVGTSRSGAGIKHGDGDGIKLVGASEADTQGFTLRDMYLDGEGNSATCLNCTTGIRKSTIENCLFERAANGIVVNGGGCQTNTFDVVIRDMTDDGMRIFHDAGDQWFNENVFKRFSVAGNYDTGFKVNSVQGGSVWGNVWLQTHIGATETAGARPIDVSGGNFNANTFMGYGTEGGESPMRFNPDEGHGNIWRADTVTEDFDETEFNTAIWDEIKAGDTYNLRRIDKLDSRGDWTDVSGSRTADTWYQNTTGRDLFVKVVLRATSSGIDLEAVLDVSPDQTELDEVDVDRHVNADTESTVSVSWTVPNGHYYQLRTPESGSFGYRLWVEQE